MPPLCDSNDNEEAVLMLTLAASGDTTYTCIRCAVETVAAMANATGMMQVAVLYPEDQTAPPPPAEDDELTDDAGPRTAAEAKVYAGPDTDQQVDKAVAASGRGRRRSPKLPAVPADETGPEPAAAESE